MTQEEEKEAEYFRQLVTDLQLVGVTGSAIGEFCGVQERQVFNWKNGDRPRGMTAVKLFLLHSKHCCTKKETAVNLDQDAISANRERAPYNGPAVYFLWLQGEIVYIGKAKSLISRLAEHFKTKVFDEVSHVVCDEKDLDRVEREAIIRYQPKLNKMIVSMNRSAAITSL